MSESKEALEVIEYLVSKGKQEDSFEQSFPFIHHFKERGGDASLKGFIEHCKRHEIEGQTNINVYKRLLHLQKQVDEFLTDNPDSLGISSIKYQVFAKAAENDIPF